MLKPKLVKVPDYSAFLNKEFVFQDKFLVKDSTVSFCKGMKFKITKVHNSKVKIKLTSPIEDCTQAIEDFAAIQVKYDKQEVKILDKIIKIWEDESDKFVIDKKSFWNKPNELRNSKGGHCINTSYPVPDSHPDKYGMAKGSDDTIMTFDYKHKEGKKNIYSYQSGYNEWYSKACYEFMRLSKLEDIQKYEKLSKETRKDIYKTYLSRGFCSKYELTINQLNKGKFKAV